jgi:hypothetical protein
MADATGGMVPAASILSMKATFNLDRCVSSINSQVRPSVPAHGGETRHVRGITVSRQSGSRPCYFAEQVAAALQARLDSPFPLPASALAL